MSAPTVLLLLTLVFGAITGAMVFGTRRWAMQTRAMRARLRAAREPIRPDRVDFSDLQELPAPVKRYLKTVLADGQPMLAEVCMQHIGTFNMSSSGEKWKAFTSDQITILNRPGFDWHGRIGPVRVHDAYIEGEGILRVALQGVLNLARLRDSQALAQGELMRFLAESVWYPTALLPGQGVLWSAVDEHSARATFADGANEVSLLFTFGQDGLAETVSTEARGRLVGGKFEPTPWQGRFWNYEERHGVKVPKDGEVSWQLPTGSLPYWRGHMTDISFETERNT